MRGPVRRKQNLLDMSPLRIITPHLHAHYLAIADDRRQNIVEIVGHATGQGADGFHLLRMQILQFHFAIFSDIPLLHDDLRDHPTLILERNSPDIPDPAIGHGGDVVDRYTGVETVGYGTLVAGTGATIPDFVAVAAFQLFRCHSCFIRNGLVGPVHNQVPVKKHDAVGNRIEQAAELLRQQTILLLALAQCDFGTMPPFQMTPFPHGARDSPGHVGKRLGRLDEIVQGSGLHRLHRDLLVTVTCHDKSREIPFFRRMDQ